MIANVLDGRAGESIDAFVWLLAGVAAFAFSSWWTVRLIAWGVRRGLEEANRAKAPDRAARPLGASTPGVCPRCGSSNSVDNLGGRWRCCECDAVFTAAKP